MRTLLPPFALDRTLPEDADVLVVGALPAPVRLVGVPDDLAAAYRPVFGDPAELAASLGVTGKAGATRILPGADGGPRIVVTGLGSEEPSLEQLRRAAGAGVRAAAELARSADQQIVVAVGLDADEPESLQAVVEGALLGAYRYAPASATTPPDPIRRLSVLSGAGGRPQRRSKAARTAPDTANAAVEAGRAVAEAVAVAREWVNLPPNLLYPETFAQEAQRLFADTKASVEVLDEKALAKGGYGGILAVGGGSSRPPRLVRVSYAPWGASAHLALVGKGITFDSGGLNLKTGEGMSTMKCDMGGAAAVLAATHAIVQLGLKVKLTCYASMAENLPSAGSYRPSDVLTMYGGATVENGNCDAEGRLVMADALARAAQEDHPDLLVDAATLTGACMVALGDEIAGVMSPSDEVAGRVLDAAESSGEQLWQLPLPAAIRDQLDSQVADLKSTSGKRSAGALVAATFLHHFVGDTDWAHLDIAGPAFHQGLPYGYVAPGGTGFGVRTLVALAAALQ